jgi:hypothetical protein
MQSAALYGVVGGRAVLGWTLTDQALYYMRVECYLTATGHHMLVAIECHHSGQHYAPTLGVLNTLKCRHRI